jgi:hypothetical protein
MNLREQLTVIEHDASLNQLRALMRNGASDEVLRVQSATLSQQARELLSAPPQTKVRVRKIPAS